MDGMVWGDQAQEIQAMGLWRKAWYPQVPVYAVVLAPGGDPDCFAGLTRIGQAQINGMWMMGDGPTIRRFAPGVIVAQRAEIIELRRMLAVEGLRKPEYHNYDALFAL